MVIADVVVVMAFIGVAVAIVVIDVAVVVVVVVGGGGVDIVDCKRTRRKEVSIIINYFDKKFPKQSFLGATFIDDDGDDYNEDNDDGDYDDDDDGNIDVDQPRTKIRHLRFAK